MNDYERQLNKSARCGSVEAYEELIRPHRGRIYSLMLSEFGNEFQASQLTQEVFIKVFESLLSHANRGSLVCEIYKTADKIIRQNSCISEKKALAASM
jgi:hypothetical protein